MTGPSSFLGRNLVGLLEEDPSVTRIAAIGTEPPSTAGAKTRFYQLDLTDPSADSKIGEVFEAEHIDTLVHLAFPASPSHATAWAHELESVGTMRLLLGARQANVRKLVHWSQTILYGAHPTNPNFLTERHPLRADRSETFFADKMEAEKEALRFSEKRAGSVVTILRTAPIVGPTVRNYVTRYLSRKIVPTMLGFDPLLQFVHEVDAIAALKVSVDRDVPGTFNIAGDGVLPLSTVVKLAGRIALPIPHPIAETATSFLWLGQLVEAPPAFLKYLRFLCVTDTLHAREKLRFAPAYTTREALLDFVNAQRLRDVRLLEEVRS